MTTIINIYVQKDVEDQTAFFKKLSIDFVLRYTDSELYKGYVLQFASKSQCIMFLNSFYYIMHSRPDLAGDLMPHHFFIIPEDEDENQDLWNHISSFSIRMAQRDINLLDNILSEVAIKQAKLEKSLDESGYIYYKNFMDEILDILHSKKLVDKNELKSKIFQTVLH